MIRSLVRAALKQRLIVAVIAAVFFLWPERGAEAVGRCLPGRHQRSGADCHRSPGRSPEEVERFATVPLEVAMTGLPGLEEMRSLNKPGLSLITLVFPTRPTSISPANWSWSAWKSARACRKALRRCSAVSTGLGEVSPIHAGAGRRR